MRSLWTIALSVALVVVVLFAWWVHREKTTAQQRSADAGGLRVRAERGDAKAQFDLGHMYLRGQGVEKDYAKALKWFQRAADQGNAKAEGALGFIYYNGQGVPQDYAEAARWYRKAADRGDAVAQQGLAYVYYNGQGVPQDHAAAAHWYRKAAEQGDAVAQQGLAYMYYNGVGVPQDYSEAVLWYRKAAEQREVVAQEFLGYMYATGRGVPIDRSQAIAWYHKAANQDDAKAKHALESLEPSGLMGRRNFELISAWIGFPVGLWLCLDFVLRGRKLRDRRQGAIAILGVVFLSNAGLSLYASHDSMSYWLHKDVFDIARWFLNTAAILIIVTVVLRAKKS